MAQLTQTKAVRTAVKEHILEYFTQDHGWDSDNAISNLKQQLKVSNNIPTTYQQGKCLATNGTFLVYYDDQRDFLKRILNQTDEASEEYDNQAVFDLYCHLIAQNIERLVK